MVVLRWGICSAGKISHDFVVGLKSLPESEHQVVAVAAGRSLDSATKFAETHTIPRAYGSYQELANDKEVDVVYVANLHGQHKDSVLMMFEAGKHVLCEKPMSVCSKDTVEMIAAARAKKVFFMEAIWTRFFPAVTELRKRIADGEIGEVKFVNAIYACDISSNPRVTERELWGGTMLSLGVYIVNLATMVFGERPESVHTTGWKMRTGVDDTTAITLKYRGERVAQLTTSGSLHNFNEVSFVGTKGILKLPALFWAPEKLETPSGVLEFPLPPLPAPYHQTNFPNSVGLCYEATAVRECILAGKTESEVCPLEHSLIVAEIMDSSLQALDVKY